MNSFLPFLLILGIAASLSVVHAQPTWNDLEREGAVNRTFIEQMEMEDRRRQTQFAGRTCSQVCTRWNTDYPTKATSAYTAATGCGAGSITSAGRSDAMRRVNLYRWLLGLNDNVVTGNTASIKESQECAKMMDANNALSHTPPTTWKCYTASGKTGAGSSNIALGYTSAAATVDGYVTDGGVPSLGHRRWIFYSALGCTTFGHYNRGGCEKVFSFGTSTCSAATGTARPFVAYPPPGSFPSAALKGKWSFSLTSGSIAGATVALRNMATGTNIAVTKSILPDGYGNPTVSWTGPTVTNQAIRVTVVVGGKTYIYTTTLVNCAVACPSSSVSPLNVSTTTTTTTVTPSTTMASCTPITTCPNFTRYCGDYADGCGGTVDCFGCSGLQDLCTAGQCVCQPATCSSKSFNCGTSVPDGCGGTIASCGTCSGTDQCMNNRCMTQACGLPTETCEDVGKDCGIHQTTCSGSGSPLNLTCGSCPLGEQCGDAGLCECPDSCVARGMDCGSPVACGKAIECGSCNSGVPCMSSNQCYDPCFGVECTGVNQVCIGGACTCDEGFSLDATGQCSSSADSTDETSSAARLTAGLTTIVVLALF